MALSDANVHLILGRKHACLRKVPRLEIRDSEMIRTLCSLVEVGERDETWTALPTYLVPRYLLSFFNKQGQQYMVLVEPDHMVFMGDISSTAKEHIVPRAYRIGEPWQLLETLPQIA